MINKTILKIVTLGIFLAFTGCATTPSDTAGKYWVTVSVPEESVQVFTKITDKEDLVDTTYPFAISKDGKKSLSQQPRGLKKVPPRGKT